MILHGVKLNFFNYNGSINILLAIPELEILDDIVSFNTSGVSAEDLSAIFNAKESTLLVDDSDLMAKAGILKILLRGVKPTIATEIEYRLHSEIKSKFVHFTVGDLSFLTK